MAQRNEAVPYETKGMEGGMDMFEKQFDGVIKVKLLATTPLVQSISFKSTKLPNFFCGENPSKSSSSLPDESMLHNRAGCIPWCKEPT